ncbi:MAG: outer membrane protein assembly factor BamE domain-containing protein [Candidatus Puniceispirillaceae bacterium]|jgi:outer membrane protein assembly factor BamE (lipoprotein component of BamABCDE complex)
MTRPSHTNISHPRYIRFALFFVASLGLAAVGGCGDRISSHGHIINENELKQINIGTTTRADILDMLGQPSFKGAFDTQKLYYSSQVMLQPVASTKQTQKRIIYIFTLDDKNMLQSIDLMNKEDGLQIAHIDDKTPTPGDTFGILEQVFSNLKRRKVEE